ncbi:gamma-glutamyltransferase [Kordiimonas pumila]|uniref:Gamma-glutamyltransferase n=1 Tax=Kordiimonas pumila TaxID=2161677 RepID=A0ABV7D8E2_9PROT|nr:gamma-glutamyltransferase [Kordiimonas pumila]
MRKSFKKICSAGTSLALSFSFAFSPAYGSEVNLKPSNWEQGQFEKFMQIEETKFPGNPEAKGYMGAVTGSYHGLAQRAGLEALKQGGTSVDAALTTAMTQIALGGGAVISYFGIMTMVHYDAATGEVTSMNAGWNTVQNETDPLSIPGGINMASKAGLFAGEASGRSALVGGFMKAVEAAHKRYGKLPFKKLFDPAIMIAEEGIPFNNSLAGYLTPRKEDLSRLPESKAVFTKENGEFYEVGDHFIQPALAKTLKKVATQGSDYMYKGPWGEKLVAAVQADGGKMTMEDLANYEVMWVDPIKTPHSGYTVYANGLPAQGGVHMVEALHLSEAANIAQLGHWSKNPESLRRASALTFNMLFSSIPQPVLEQMYPGIDMSLESRIKPETAQKIWSRMEAGVMPVQYAEQKPSHSDTVVAVDKWGNMTAIVHSINSVVWGKTAIIIDGVSIGDPGAFQKELIAQTGQGKRLPDPTEAGLLFKNGAPVLAFSSMATGLHQQTFQSLVNVMDFGMTPKEALDAPAFFLPRPVGGDAEKGIPPKWMVRVMDGEFDDTILEATGLPIEKIKPEDRRYIQGLWVGIARDPKTGEIKAASHPYTNGQAVAY